jgi:hypothetical protein
MILGGFGMILAWTWYGSGIELVWLWNGIRMVLEWFWQHAGMFLHVVLQVVPYQTLAI